jgi:hypothetical protein
MSTIDAFTSIAAWVGAIAGIGGLVFTTVTWRMPRHKVVVRVTNSFFLEESNSVVPHMVCVKAINLGKDPVGVVSWGIDVVHGNLSVFRPFPHTTRLPHELNSNQEAIFFVEASELYKCQSELGVSFNKMKPWVTLATGQRIRCRRGIPLAEAPRQGTSASDPKN